MALRVGPGYLPNIGTPLRSSFRPAMVGSPGKTRMGPRTTFTYQVKNNGDPTTRTRTIKGSMSMELRLADGFERFLRDRGRITPAIAAVDRVHGNMAFGTVQRAAQLLEERVKENPRPNREGRIGLRETLRRRYEELYTIYPAISKNAGFIVDFERLDTIGPFDVNGEPYWRFVEGGFGGGPVRALFGSPGEGLSPPSNMRRQWDVTMPNMPKGAIFTISGFEGYGFIRETLTARASDLRATAFEQYLFEIGWDDRVTETAVAFVSGGSQRGGRMRSGSGKFMRDERPL